MQRFALLFALMITSACGDDDIATATLDASGKLDGSSSSDGASTGDAALRDAASLLRDASSDSGADSDAAGSALNDASGPDASLCKDGEVVFVLKGEQTCAPKCSTADDCAVASYQNECCPGCASVYPRSIVDSETCLVEAGETVPRSCEPVRCPDEPCPLRRCVAVEATCTSDGRCANGAGQF